MSIAASWTSGSSEARPRRRPAKKQRAAGRGERRARQLSRDEGRQAGSEERPEAIKADHVPKVPSGSGTRWPSSGFESAGGRPVP